MYNLEYSVLRQYIFEKNDLYNLHSGKLGTRRRRPWVKMRIEYDRTLIFTAFCEDLSNLGCMPFLWLNSIGKLAKWCFRLSETMILRVFGNDVTNWSLQGFASFFFIL